MQIEERIPYKKLNPEIQEEIIHDRQINKENIYKCKDEDVIRRDMNRDRANLWRPAFVRDIEKIMHLPVYNRYSDKTQVFSFYKNDDITHRSLHVQLVSRIGRSIGAVLGLNLDLIEAIALGHDIGHTPFGHEGEKYLSNILYKETGCYFNHNVHSVRVLDTIYRRNLSLQTLDGVLCHNGEFEMQEYRPKFIKDCKENRISDYTFTKFDELINNCDKNGATAIKKLIPCTLEGCVVRICDMIAYLGKDRQDAITARIIKDDSGFTSQSIGTQNAAIINNLTVDIINNSYGKDYIQLSKENYEDLKIAKKENYEKIYLNPEVAAQNDEILKPMFIKLFYRLLDDVIKKDESSIIWKHHINYIKRNTGWYNVETDNNDYSKVEPNRIVADFIASMTDDYFIDLFELLFPNSELSVEYKSYFEE